MGAAAKTRYLPPLEAAYKEAEALGADANAPAMQEARLLLEELQLEATVREAEAAGGPAEEAELLAANGEENSEGGATARGGRGRVLGWWRFAKRRKR